jgi:hypothetical protein
MLRKPQKTEGNLPFMRGRLLAFASAVVMLADRYVPATSVKQEI